MADKLKCPFCGAELQHWGEDFLYCENLGCPMSPQIELPISIWQALIAGKKARDTLEYAIGVLDNLTEIGGVDMEIIKIKQMAGITKQEE